jgi:hypothetical protein
MAGNKRSHHVNTDRVREETFSLSNLALLPLAAHLP